jgi:hypothetical protein
MERAVRRWMLRAGLACLVGAQHRATDMPYNRVDVSKKNDQKETSMDDKEI